MNAPSRHRDILPLVGVALVPALLVFVLLMAAGGRVDPSPAQAQAPAPAEGGLRVFVVVLDGMMPHEVRPDLTPTLHGLKAQGTWYKQARAVYPAETIPNHVAMMTGVLPARNGVIGNDYWTPNSGGSPRSRVAHPRLLGADTLVTRLESRCTISTATVQSKGYLWGIFRSEPPKDPTAPPGLTAASGDDNPDHPGQQREADHHWKPMGQPGYIPDPDDHAVDQAVMDQGVMPWLTSNPTPPQFGFINLGDVDRSGHVDMTGVSVASGGISAFRQAAIADTDTQVKKFIDQLKSAQVWDESVVIFTSDHGMDWSVPDNGLNRSTVLRSINISEDMMRRGYTQNATGTPGKSSPTSRGDYVLVPGGGTAAIYFEEEEDIADVADVLLDVHPGVEAIATREPIPGVTKNVSLAEMGMDHRDNGDIVVLAKKGWSVRDTANENPIPGNHGHPATQNSLLMVSGGHPALDDAPEEVDGEAVYNPAEKLFSKPAAGPGNLSVAPTVAALFGIGEPAGGYDGKPLTDAFEAWALAPHQACQAGSPAAGPSDGDGAGDGDPDPAGDDSTTPGDPSTTADPGTTPAGPEGGARPAPAGSERGTAPTAAPALSGLAVRPRSFLARTSVPSIARHKGARVSYTNTQPSRTTFTVQRALAGYRRGGRCVPRKRGTQPRGKRCRFYRLVHGSFARSDTPGRNSFRMSGWVAGRKLRPGAYRLQAIARNALGRSRAARTTFRVRRP